MWLVSGSMVTFTAVMSCSHREATWSAMASGIVCLTVNSENEGLPYAKHLHNTEQG